MRGIRVQTASGPDHADGFSDNSPDIPGLFRVTQGVPIPLGDVGVGGRPVGTDDDLSDEKGFPIAVDAEASPCAFKGIPPKGKGVNGKADTPKAVVGGMNRTGRPTGLPEKGETPGNAEEAGLNPVRLEKSVERRRGRP